MKSSIFQLLVILLFTYYTPIQSQSFTIREAFVKDQRYVTNDDRSTMLNKVQDNTYEIEETIIRNDMSEEPEPGTYIRETIEIRGFLTMLTNIVVFVTDYIPIQIELENETIVQEIFDLSGRHTLEKRLYTYKVNDVYKQGKGRILSNVSITGFEDQTLGDFQSKYIIHSGEANAADVKPHIIWTSDNFNYRIFRDSGMVVTLIKPGNNTYENYLVLFANADEFVEWKETFGIYNSPNIPVAPDFLVQ